VHPVIPADNAAIVIAATSAAFNFIAMTVLCHSCNNPESRTAFAYPAELE